MKGLIDSGCVGTVDWIGAVRNRSDSLCSDSLESVDLVFEGMACDDHHGLTRPACTRVDNLYAQGTEIRNVRQLSIVSTEDVAEIAELIGLDQLAPPPHFFGANFVLRGIPHFTLIPPSSRLQFSRGATLTVDLENLPCHLPAREIAAANLGDGRGFKSAATRRRGVLAWVEREGQVRCGDSVKLFVPSQPSWPFMKSITC
ncbi:MAG: MOSC domain-containing protein [Rhodobacteraceae bacterium]|nr:MOSC domain-containing protein [Paracoccaceae bacterium]